jgi:hypothetical protein
MEVQTSNLTKQLNQVDDRIAALKLNIEKAEAVMRLEQNDDFKLIILDGYLGDEAKRLFEVLVEPSTLKRDVMENIHDKLNSIRNLKQYFGVLGQNSDMAPDQIVEEEDYRQQVTKYFSEHPEELYDDADASKE